MFLFLLLLLLLDAFVVVVVAVVVAVIVIVEHQAGHQDPIRVPQVRLLRRENLLHRSALQRPPVPGVQQRERAHLRSLYKLNNEHFDMIQLNVS